MPIDSNHREYDGALEMWQKCKDAFDGQDAVRDASTKYLPRLSGQDDREYRAYRDRADFPEATSRTIMGMLGQVFRKPPDAEIDKMELWWDDIDLGGKSITQFAFDAVLNVLLYGRFGILADYSVDERRPYLAAYPAFSVINWREDRITGKNVVSHVVLHEEIDRPKADDEYETEIVRQIRILSILTGVYTVELWQKSERDRDWVQITDSSEVIPSRFGKPLDEIPFICVGPFGTGMSVQKSPMLPLVNMNYSIYRTSADLENGLHFCGCPTPWGAGINPDEGPFRIGAPEAWMFANPDAKVAMLEFTGQGLEPLESAWARKIETMGALGAYLLAPAKKAAETAEAKRIDAASEGSVLSAVVDNVSRAMTWALARCNAWAGGNPDVVAYKLNKDFWSARLSSQELHELVLAWQAGAFDQRTLLYNLREGEILDPETTDDEVMDRLMLEEPTFAPVQDQAQDQVSVPDE